MVSPGSNWARVPEPCSFTTSQPSTASPSPSTNSQSWRRRPITPALSAWRRQPSDEGPSRGKVAEKATVAPTGERRDQTPPPPQPAEDGGAPPPPSPRPPPPP